MDLSLTFLGTSASVPSAARGTSATLLARGGTRWLVDCGEGTQRQLLRSGLGLVDIDMLLITHLHGDHYLGLIGLLKTYALRGRERELPVVGPSGLRARMDLLQPVIGRLPFEVTFHEVGAEEAVWFEDGSAIRAFPTHHTITSVGYCLVEDGRPGVFDADAARRLGVAEGPDFGRIQRGDTVMTAAGKSVGPDDVLGPPRAGRRVVLTGDTAPCASTLQAAEGATVLVHEATFLHEERDRAKETRHSTAREAGVLATEAGVGLLVLTHLSMRTPPRLAREEAEQQGVRVVVPNDFDQIAIPFPERGPAELVSAASIDRQVTVAASTIGADAAASVTDTNL